MKRKDLKLKDNFLTNNCYSCIEINAHSMLHIILYTKEKKLSHAFLPHLMDSQPCESFFRKIRSLTCTYSTVANCSMKEIIGRIGRIELMDRITLADSNIEFPRTKKAFIGNVYDLPTKTDICEEIEKCKYDALQFAVDIGLLNNKNSSKYSFECLIEPFKPHKLQKRPVLTNDVDFFTPQIDLNNLNLKDFSDKITSKNILETSPYVAVGWENNQKIIKKNISVLAVSSRAT